MTGHGVLVAGAAGGRGESEVSDLAESWKQRVAFVVARHETQR